MKSEPFDFVNNINNLMTKQPPPTKDMTVAQLIASMEQSLREKEKKESAQ